MIDKNDQRLTAYALGELAQEEAAEFEQLIDGDDDALNEVRSIRETTKLIRAALDREATPVLTPSQRRRIENAAAHPDNPVGTDTRSSWRWVLLAAAACVVLGAFLGLPHLSSPAREKARLAMHEREDSEDLLARTDLDAPPAQEAARHEPEPVRREQKTGPAKPAEEAMSALGAVADSTATQAETAAAAAPMVDRMQQQQPRPRTMAKAGPADAAAPAPMAARRELRMARQAKTEALGGVEAKPQRLRRSARLDEALGRGGGPVEDMPAATVPSREAYDRIYENPFRNVVTDPLSTFSIGVDTASYSNVRRFLNRNQLPPPDAVRIEEMVNYFRYDYAPPTDEHPFAVHVDVAACPWQADHRLVRIALKGRVPEDGARPPANLVFLVDVSGSMRSPDKLPLLKSGLEMLVQQLTEKDRVAIVAYAGASGLVLPPTAAYRKEQILEAIRQLQAGGSTNAGAGIELAYTSARQNYIAGGINRVILASDGDFNVGITDRGQLTRLIEDKARHGIFLSVLGFGTGNLQDATMEQLAAKGNGVYAYIDSRREARKVLVEQVGATLHTIAKDVKIQVEFNPTQARAYRLIGYENRILHHQDFDDDTKDAGEIGAGHTVTALYEVIPADAPDKAAATAGTPLRYQQGRPLTDAADTGELMTVSLRYKQPHSETGTRIRVPVTDTGSRWENASDDFQFSSAVALFGMILRRSEHSGNANLDTVIELASPAAERDPHGTRTEFLDLARKAKALRGQ